MNSGLQPIRVLGLAWVLCFLLSAVDSGRAVTPFSEGVQAYTQGDYTKATRLFRKAATEKLTSGTLRNLGNSEWKRGNSGTAILAWEQSLWLDTYERGSRENLKFARRAAQLDTPELSWFEVISTWLPINVWPWITAGALWLAVGMVLLPEIFGRRKQTWHQAAAAVSLTLFLLTLPAHAGVYARTRLGVILYPETPLRLTPTAEAQVTARLSAGEPARVIREKQRFILVRTNRQTGWIERSQLGWICPPSGRLEQLQVFTNQ